MPGAGENGIARPFGQAAEAIKVHADQVTPPLHDLARNEDGVHVAGVHEVDDGARKRHSAASRRRFTRFCVNEIFPIVYEAISMTWILNQLVSKKPNLFW